VKACQQGRYNAALLSQKEQGGTAGAQQQTSGRIEQRQRPRAPEASVAVVMEQQHHRPGRGGGADTRVHGGDEVKR